ncbi:zinc finger, CCHC-type containing protein [Tanacetum coccineum]
MSSSSSSSSSSYTSEIIQEDTNNPSVFTLYLNRPTGHNALSLTFFSEFPHSISSLDQNLEVSVIMLSCRGKHFCAGIDLTDLNSISSSYSDVPSDCGRSGEKQLHQIKMMQMTTSSANNSVFKGFFEKQKLTRTNFIDWYRQIRILLSIEDKLNYLEHPIPAALVPTQPDQQVAPEALAAHAAWVKGSKEIAGLMLLAMEPKIQ